ncbi:chitobiase/beta-hexosaminidase C-terminal domain-containing protein [Candidatus Woesebacteria bacterium]|nr:chitobiase/beta-hexosaminidase C-terminal domain-containing protein [Candidatus Woesebacteria bacterium]
MRFSHKKQLKIRAVFAILLILLQNISPVFLLARPAFAQESPQVPVASNVTLGFDSASHELVLSGVVSTQTEYLATYQSDETDAPLQKAVQGTVGTDGSQFQKKLYVGSCSGAVCVPDEISQGTLSLPEAGYAASFQIKDGILWLNDRSVQTVSKVQLNTAYVAPQNPAVTISFTRLPENPGTLSIREILLSEEQAREIGAISPVAYDITSSMENGTFEYDLTLPVPEGKAHSVQMVYAEDVAGLTHSSRVRSITAGVSTAKTITATKLDHFTVFAVVQPQNMARNTADVTANTSSWFFYNDENDTIDNTLGSFVTGPASAPYGTGSVQISVSGSQRRNLATYQFSGTPLTSITELGFSTYNPSVGNGGGAERTGYLNFNVDFDGSDTWQRRLIFVPPAASVVQDSWQAWDAIAGGAALWHYSGSTWPVTGEPGTTTKTWSQILSDYPSARIRVTDSWFGIRVGSPYNSGYTENIDAVVFGTAAGTTVFNFEPLVLTAPTNLGWNTRTGSATAGERAVDVVCGAVTNADYPTYGNGMTSHNWSTTDTVSNLKYQRQYSWPGSAFWSTDGTVYSATNTNFGTFGSAAGTEGVWNTRVRSWYDSNDNNILEEGSDAVSAWSNECSVTYDRTAPSIPANPSPHNTTLTTNNFDFEWDDSSDATGITYQFQSSLNPAESGGVLTAGLWSSGVLPTSMIHSSGAPDGTWYWQVRAVDAAGNTSAWSPIWNVTLDTTAPAIPTHLTPANGTYTTTANLTKIDWSTVSDSSNPVTYFYQSAFSNILNLDGSFMTPAYSSAALSASEIAAGGTPEGVYYWHVRAQDLVGNTSAWSTPWKITVDNTSPTVAITAPTVTSVSGVIPIRGSVVDANPHHYWLVILDASNAVIAGPGTVNDSTSFSDKLFFSWDTSLVPEGTYTVRLEARDAANNKDAGSVATKTIVVDRTAPTPDIVFPGTGPAYTSFNVVFSEDVVQSEAENPANYFLNNWPGAGGSGDLVGDATITYDQPSKTATIQLINPGWYFSPEQEWGVQNIHDLAGNVQAPTPYMETTTAMVAPVTTDSGTDAAWHTAAVTVTLSCDDNTVSLGSGCNTTYYTTDGSIPTTASAQGNTVVVSGEGVTTIKYFSVDKAGNVEAVKTAANTVKIDATKPTSTITSYGLANGGSVETATFTGLIEGTASDIISGVDHVLLSISHLDFGADVSDTQYWDATSSAWISTASTFSATGSTAWSYQLSSVPEGIYTITSHAVDVAGNVENTYKITIVYDRSIPQVVLTINPTTGNGDNGWYITQPSISLAASDNHSLDHIEYQWNSTTGTWITYTSALLPPGEGQNVLYYRSVDTVGNISTVGVKEVRYDITQPEGQPQNVKVDNIANSKADGSWSAPANADGVDYYQLSWKHEDGTEHSATVSNTTFVYQLSELYDGAWTFVVRAKDFAGHYTESSVGFRVGSSSFSSSSTSSTTASTEGGSVLGASTSVGTGGTTTTATRGSVLGISDTANNEVLAPTQQSDTVIKTETDTAGEVLGTTSSCSTWQYYLPILLLALQLLVLIGFLIFRNDSLWVELLILIGTTTAVISAFLVMKSVGCYVEGSWIAFVAQWFVALSLAITACVKLISFALTHSE